MSDIQATAHTIALAYERIQQIEESLSYTRRKLRSCLGDPASRVTVLTYQQDAQRIMLSAELAARVFSELERSLLYELDGCKDIIRQRVIPVDKAYEPESSDERS